MLSSTVHNLECSLASGSGRYIHATTWTERIADKQWKKLNTLRPGDKIINTQFIVLEKRESPHVCEDGPRST